MNIRINLSLAAFTDLVSFCKSNLKDGIEPENYAAELTYDQDNWGEKVVFEIKASHSKSGIPVTISFSNDSDFDWDSI